MERFISAFVHEGFLCKTVNFRNFINLKILILLLLIVQYQSYSIALVEILKDFRKREGEK